MVRVINPGIAPSPDTGPHEGGCELRQYRKAQRLHALIVGPGGRGSVYRVSPVATSGDIYSVDPGQLLGVPLI